MILILLIVSLGLWILYGGSYLPQNIDEIIAEKLKEGPIELITGETGYADNDGLKIYYERHSLENPKGTILLINGHTNTIPCWPQQLVISFVDSGYQVIKYDNRDVGFSARIENYDKKNPYLLEDMATDGLAVLDLFNIEQAHVIGVSMGGMIAQTLALQHSERIISLTSIMSTGYFGDKKDDPISKRFKLGYVRLTKKYGKVLDKIENKIKLNTAIMGMLKGKGNYETDFARWVDIAVFELQNRKGFNPLAVDRHSIAILKSGSRLDELKNINIPTLVIHGMDDPLISIGHGKRYAEQIPNVQTLFIKGMGHDLPAIFLPEITDKIQQLICEL